MLINDFSRAAKELQTVYDVEGKSVVLTAKERENKRGAHTYFNGTVNGEPFTHCDITAICRLVNGGKVRGPRKTACTPVHSHKVETPEAIMQTALREFNEAADKVRELSAKFGFRTGVSETENEIRGLFAAKTEAAQINKLRATFDRLHAIRAAQLKARENTLDDANRALTAAAVSGDVKRITAAAAAVQTAAAAVDEFKKRVYVFE